MALPYDDKAKLVSAIYAYYCVGRKQGDMVALTDPLTGNIVGTFTEQRGLEMDQAAARSF